MLLCGTLVQMVILILQPVITTYVAKLAGPMPNIVFVAGFVFSLGGIAGAMAAPFWGRSASGAASSVPCASAWPVPASP